MSSEIDICNLALSHLGDTATVTSIDPPEGSAQAEHCARFYPMARDALLEMHAWGFATRRAVLPLLSSGWPEWDYCYAQPNDLLNILAILPPQANDDYSQTFGIPNYAGVVANYAPITAAAQYSTQPYSAESLDDGTQVIYTDQAEAVIRYTVRITDPVKFSPLFVTTLSWKLAGMLAGPMIKGDAGQALAQRCEAVAMQYMQRATESDSNQRRIAPKQIVPWISGR